MLIQGGYSRDINRYLSRHRHTRSKEKRREGIVGTPMRAFYLTEPQELEDATEPRRPGGVRHRQRARRKMEDAALSMPMVQSALDLSMPLEQLNLELSMPLTQSGLDMPLPPGDSAAGDDGGRQGKASAWRATAPRPGATSSAPASSRASRPCSLPPPPSR